MSDVEDQEDGSQYEFDKAFQSKIASLFLRDTTFALRSKDLIQPEFFTDQAVGALVRIVQEHVKVYKAAPDLKIIPTLLKDEIAKKRIRPDLIPEVKEHIRSALSADLSNSGFVLSKVTDFAKQVAMEQAIMAAVPLLEKGNYKAIETVMKSALSVGAGSDSQDYDYWEEIGNRTQKRHDINAGKIVKRGITTGYAAMDAYLYHLGWGRKEISVLMGAAKAGKSMGLGDFSKNASLAGFNVFYAGLEVASSIIAERLDAAISDIMMKSLHMDPNLVEAKIRAMQAQAGALKMRDFASGTLKPSVLLRVLEDYRAEGIIFDLCAVDYADIMAAEYRSDKLADNLREIYIDLRAIGHEMDLAMLTATQTNRNGAGALTAQATDVGDDFNKVRTADILIGINATDAEKAKGEARLFWAVSRNTEDGFSLLIKQDRSKLQFIKSIIKRI